MSPSLASKLAYRLWFTPRRKPRPEREHAWLATATERFFLESNGEDIACYAWGKGPTILLSHGWEGRGSQLGGMVEPLLARGFRVVCYDAPGHGDSSGKQTDIVEMSEIIAQLAAKEESIHGVIAHSLGTVATVHAIASGLPVRGVVLISPPARLEYFTQVFGRTFQLKKPVVRGLENLIEKRFPQLGSGLWKMLSNERRVSSLGIPGLVIHDTEDDLVPFNQGQRVARAWKGAHFLATNGLGHRRILYNQGVIAQVATFMAALPKRP